MNASTFIAVLLLFVLMACTAGSPFPLAGDPGSKSLLVIEGRIVRFGKYRDIDKYLVIGPLGLKSSKKIEGKRFKRYFIFDNLEPGLYKLVNAKAKYRTQSGTQEYSLSFGDKLKFNAVPGKPIYIGKIVIIVTWESGEDSIDGKFDARPVFEKRAWKTILPLVGRSPWSAPIQNRLDAIP